MLQLLLFFRQAFGLITSSWQSYASIFFEQLDKYVLKQALFDKFMISTAAKL